MIRERQLSQTMYFLIVGMPFLIAIGVLMFSTHIKNQNQTSVEGISDTNMEEITTVSQEEVQNASEDENIVIIDVRTPAEYDESHIPGAINIDIYGEDFNGKVQELDKDKTYYVYCRTGGRSSSAISIMTNAGHESVFQINGDFVAWQEAGLPTDSSD